MWQWPEPHTGSSGIFSFGAKERDTLLIGMEVRDLIPFVQNAQEVPSHIRFHRADADGVFHGIRHGHFLQVVGGKIHLQQVALFRHGEDPAEGGKGNFLRLRLDKPEDDIPGSQRGMAAQVDLSAGSEPPQMVVLPFLHGKGRLGEVVLYGNGHHGLLREPLFHNAHGSGVSREHVIGKGIHNILDHSFILLALRSFRIL